MPYSMYDNGRQMAGEGAGWLGAKYDPILMRTPFGEPYGGVSRYDVPALNLKLGSHMRKKLKKVKGKWTGLSQQRN